MCYPSDQFHILCCNWHEFRVCFCLLSATDMVIIYLSSGITSRESSEQDKRATLSVVREENRHLNNSVMILTYALMNGMSFVLKTLFLRSGFNWLVVCSCGLFSCKTLLQLMIAKYWRQNANKMLISLNNNWLNMNVKLWMCKNHCRFNKKKTTTFSHFFI